MCSGRELSARRLPGVCFAGFACDLTSPCALSQELPVFVRLLMSLADPLTLSLGAAPLHDLNPMPCTPCIAWKPLAESLPPPWRCIAVS